MRKIEHDYSDLPATLNLGLIKFLYLRDVLCIVKKIKLGTIKSDAVVALFIVRSVPQAFELGDKNWKNILFSDESR